ncbi:unnamed protein product [Adineta ricciae]|uniref:Uncharacterized protein n=1 Tax=Adineta ricciae TaxID=249248 RepID=A0A815ZD37_ADIRI|nr:unnamed protein product [Adineta ricciae]
MRPKIDVLPSYEKAVQNLNEPPPSYATVIESEDTSSCTVSKLIKYTCKHFATYKLATALATVLILFSIVSLTALIIGVRDHSSCSRRLTPAIWLIVFGAFTFVCCWLMSILTMARTFFADPYRRWCKIALIIVSISICVFNLTWGFLVRITTASFRIYNRVSLLFSKLLLFLRPPARTYLIDVIRS